MRDSLSTPASRPSMRRSQSITQAVRRSSDAQSVNSIAGKVEKKCSDARKNERPARFFGSFFNLPKPPDPKPERQ